MPAEPRVFIFTDRRGAFRWSIVATNGRKIAIPGSSFSSRESCSKGIDRLRALAGKSQIFDDTSRSLAKQTHQSPQSAFAVFIDKRGEYRWRLIDADAGIVARSSEGYMRKRDCLKAISLVRDSVRSSARLDPQGDGFPTTRMRLPTAVKAVVQQAPGRASLNFTLCISCCERCQTLATGLSKQCEIACSTAVFGCFCRLNVSNGLG